MRYRRAWLVGDSVPARWLRRILLPSIYPIVLLLCLPVAWITAQRDGVVALLLATGSCALGGLVGWMLARGLPVTKSRWLWRLGLASAARMAVPLAIALAVVQWADYLVRAGFAVFLIVSYLAGLTAETLRLAWQVREVGPQNQQIVQSR